MADLMNAIMNVIGDAPMKGLTGMNQREIYDRGAEEFPEMEFDKGQHRLASREMANRVGGPVANAIGFWKEMATGAANKLEGGKFMGETGYSPQDMLANWQGIDDSERQKQNLMNAALQGILGGR